MDKDDIDRINKLLNVKKNMKLFETNIAAICGSNSSVIESSFESSMLETFKQLVEKTKNSFAPEDAKLEGDRVKHYTNLAKIYKRIK